jgi:hypothetical protein
VTRSWTSLRGVLAVFAVGTMWSLSAGAATANDDIPVLLQQAPVAVPVLLPSLTSDATRRGTARSTAGRTVFVSGSRDADRSPRPRR